MYRIESKIVEELKEQELNVTALLQEQARKNKNKNTEVIETLLQMTADLNKVIKTLYKAGATTEEIIKLLETEGMMVEKVEND